MEDSPVQLNEVIGRSLELSRAINDLGALTVISGIFLALVVIMFGFFIYQLVNYQRQLVTIGKASENILAYLSNKMQKSISEDQARVIISRSYERLRLSCIVKLSKLKLDSVKSEHDMRQFVGNLNRDHLNYLQKFVYKDSTLSSMVDTSWVEPITEVLMKYYSDDSLDIYEADEELQATFESYAHSADNQITLIN